MNFILLEFLSICVAVLVTQTGGRTSDSASMLTKLAQSSSSGCLKVSWEDGDIAKTTMRGVVPEIIVYYTTNSKLPIEDWMSKNVTNTHGTTLAGLYPSTAYSIRLELHVRVYETLPMSIFLPIKASPECKGESTLTESVTCAQLQEELVAMRSVIERVDVAITESFAKLEAMLARLDSRMNLLEDVAKALSNGKCELSIVHPPRRMTCRI